MGRITQRLDAIEDLKDFFEELGEVPSARSYYSMEEKPLSNIRIRGLFRTYPRAVRAVQKKHPQLLKKPPVSIKSALDAIVGSGDSNE